MDDGCLSSRQDLKAALKPKIDAAAPKRRKVVGKNVVTVRIEAGVGKQKGEGPPSDLWSWRKYGQKPIKGSPYPRGYYKCSTSKGCSAKKQVERCKTDSSVLIITYTSDHNHPGPSLLSTNAITTIPSPKRQSIEEEEGHHQSPLKRPEEPTQQNPMTKEVERSNHGHLNIKSSSSSSSSQSSSQSSSHEEINDFFDELEELHMPSPFTSLMRSNFFDERLLQTTLVDVAGGWSLIP